MTEDERISNLHHAFSNPLSSILGETDMLLTGDTPLDEETRRGLEEVQRLAMQLRDILKASRADVLSSNRNAGDAGR